MNRHSFYTALLCLAGLSSGCAEAQTADLKAPTPVKIQSVESFAAGGGLRYSATIRPSAQMDLAFKNGGFVDSIHQTGGRLVDRGDVVERGTTLARLRPADFDERAAQAAAQLDDARAVVDSLKAKGAENRARLERAERDFARAESLFDSESLTRSSYDAARAEVDAARAKVDSSLADVAAAQSRIRGAEAMAAEARLAVQDTALDAPMSGTVVERSIENGSLIGAGKAAFVLADTRTVKAVFGVPDLEIRSVRPGMPLEVTSEAVPGRRFMGRITSVAPAADEKSRIFETEVSIPNPDGILKIGMIASVVVGEQAAAGRVAVPLSAVVRSRDNAEGYAVFVVEPQGGRPVARLRSVALGDAFGNMIVVAGGLTVGESVITVGASLVQDGAPIQIVP